MHTISLWHELTTSELAALDPERTVAVLPVAAIEQHGPHLPLATDALINEGLIARLLRRPPGAGRVLILPPLVAGHSLEHVSFPGTLSVGAETLLALWEDVGRSVARAGLRKLVILNTHGGQSPLVHLAAVRLRAAAGMFVVRANYFAFGTPPGLFAPDELAHGIHGGEVETSLLLHLRPELVRREALAHFEGLGARMAGTNALLGPERPVGFGWMSEDLHPQGVCGNAAAADAERGRQLLEHLAERLGRLLEEVIATPLPQYPLR